MKYSAKLIKDLSWQKYCLLWILDQEIKNEKGMPLEFRDHRFLIDIYDDWTPVQTVRKASQIGYSTLEILKSFWGAKYKKYNIIYSLPTFQDVIQFVPSKVNALITQNPVLTELTKDKDTILQKKIGDGFIYYRGTFSKKTEQEKMGAGIGIMFSSDLNIHDEADRSDQAILEQYESRLEASQFRGRWYFSNPTTPHTKSQILWEQSDQKHWFIKCRNHHWQYLDYWKNVKGGKFICSTCGAEITDDERRNGQWVRKYLNKDISGYWIPHLICPWISAQKIEEQAETKSKQYFYNFVLGLPYIGSDVVVNRDIILRNIDITEQNKQEHNVLGVDQGLKKYYVLGNRQGIFKIGVTETWDEIEELIKVYDVETAVFDALPDLTEPRKLLGKYPGIVWLNYYKKEVRKAEFIKWDYKTHTVYCDRSKIIQQVIDEMVNRKIRFQMRQMDLEDYIKHWQSLYKITQKDDMGIERNLWETEGEDHFCHATIYWRLALETKGEGKGGIKFWDVEDEKPGEIAPDLKRMAKKQEEFIE